MTECSAVRSACCECRPVVAGSMGVTVRSLGAEVVRRWPRAEDQADSARTHRIAFGVASRGSERAHRACVEVRYVAGSSELAAVLRSRETS